MSEIELKQAFEIKSVNDETGVIEGYASTFDDTPDSCNDVVAPGAFAKSIQMVKNVKLLYGHDWKEVIGRVTELFEDTHGLYFKAKVSMTERGKEVLQLIKDGALNQTSIGYVTEKSTYRHDNVRVLEEVKLHEISVVPFPANENAYILGVKQQVPSDEIKTLTDAINELKGAVEALQPAAAPQESKQKQDELDAEEKAALESLLESFKTK